MRRLTLFMLVSSLLTTLVFGVWNVNIPSVRASSSIHQGDLVLTGNNVTVIEGRFDINGSIVVEENATLILRNAMLNFTQIERFQFGMTFQKSVNGYPRLIVKNATIITNNYQMRIRLYENSSAKIDALSTPISFDHHVAIELYDDSSVSMTRSTGGSIVSFQDSTVTLTKSSMWAVGGFDNSNMTLSNSTLNSVGSSTRTLGGNVRVTAKNCTIITTTLVSSQLDLNLSISGLKPSFVNIWDFKTNSSAVGAEVPDLILKDTYVGGWSFMLHGKSNATISNSELFMQRTYDVSTWYLYGTKVEQLYAHGGWINTFDSIVNHVYALGSDAKIFAVNSTISYQFQPTGNSEIFFSWYLEVHLIDSMGQDVPLANVVATYSNGTVAGSKLTDADGWARLTLMEKLVNASGEYHVGNYTVEAALGPHSTDTSVNMTENKQITLTLEDFLLPSLIGEGWGRIRIKPKHGWIWGTAKLYKIGDEQIQLVISQGGKEYTKVWNIIYYRKRKHSETYFGYNRDHGPLIVTIYKRWSMWRCRGRGVKAKGFIENQ